MVIVVQSHSAGCVADISDHDAEVDETDGFCEGVEWEGR